MDAEELAVRLREKEEEAEFLKAEVLRLRSLIASGAGSAEEMLRRRGFTVFKKGRGPDVLMPPGRPKRLAEEYYRLLKKYSFRLLLRDIIKLRSGFTCEGLVKYSTLQVVRGYVDFLAGAGLVEPLKGGGWRLVSGARSFGPTLEWFVSEVLRREFLADTVWGVSFKGSRAGGDYDVIASIEGMLLYAEVKSSPPKQIYDREVGAFIARHAELSPELSMFVVDTELRMKDKVVALFEQVLPGTALAGTAVTRLKGELFRVGERVFIVNSKDSLVANIGAVLGWYLKKGAHAG